MARLRGLGASYVALPGCAVDFGAPPEPPPPEPLTPREADELRMENARRAAAERERLENWSSG